MNSFQNSGGWSVVECIPRAGALVAVCGVGAVEDGRLASGMAGSRPHVKIQRLRLQIDGRRTVGCNRHRSVRPARFVLHIRRLSIQ